MAHSFPRDASDPVGSFVLRLAVALREEGIESEVIAPAAPGLSPQDEFEGVRVQRFRYAPRRMETLAYEGTMAQQVRSRWTARAAMAGFLAAETGATLRAVQDFQPNLLHAHWWFPGGAVGALVKSVWGLPLVTTLHGSDVRVVEGWGVARRMFGHVLRRSTLVTAVSNWLARQTRGLAPYVEPVVAPMPIDPSHFALADHRPSDNRILFVGKLNPQKGIDHLLRALSEMTHDCTLDVVVGVGTPDGEARRAAAELGVASRVRWHPLLPQRQLAKLYQSATILALPAVDEGLSLVAIEAQLCGAPVVAFDSGGLPDIVSDGRTGFLVAPGNHRGLAQAFDTILDLPDRGAAMGQAGRTQMLESFAPAAVARRYAAIYRQAMA